MSQRPDDNDQLKNFYQMQMNLPPPPVPIRSQQQQQQNPSSSNTTATTTGGGTTSSNLPPPTPIPQPMTPYPYAAYMDWNYPYYPNPYDMYGYMAAAAAAAYRLTPFPGQLPPTDNTNKPPTSSANTSMISAAGNQPPNTSTLPPPLPFDPGYMYYQAAAPYNPYANYHYMTPQYLQPTHSNTHSMVETAPSVAGGQPSDIMVNSRKQQERLRSVSSIKNEEIEMNDERNSRVGGQYASINEQPQQTTSSQANELQQLIEPSQIKSERLTPLLHHKPHSRAIFAGFNYLIKIKSNDPCEGQPAIVEIHNVNDIIQDYLVRDPNYQQIQEYPGPLVKDITPKATILQYCQKKIKECLSNTLLIDSQSHSLLWEYLALLVRQNGIVDLKIDVSPLLINENQNWNVQNAPIKSGQATNSSNSSSLAPTPSVLAQEQIERNEGAGTPTSEINSITDSMAMVNVSGGGINTQRGIKQRELSDEEILCKLRELLASGQLLDAIEFSIKHNLWSHAFFLSMQYGGDRKVLDKTKLRFLNSLQSTDPLQTCYQLLNGRVPAITSNLMSAKSADWNDWRRHLAMIVSNLNDTNRELCIQSIKTMADCLATNSRVAAAHFCYLLANVNFGEYKKKSSKIVLIGSSHNQEFHKFCQISAIQATEIYEFATQRILDHLLQYKLIYAIRLTEYGLLNEAYKYVEQIANFINSNPNMYMNKISTVYHLANRLRINDVDYQLQQNQSNGGGGNISFTEPQWFTQLTQNFYSVCFGTKEEATTTTTTTTTSQNSGEQYEYHHQQSINDGLAPPPASNSNHQVPLFNVNSGANTKIESQNSNSNVPNESQFEFKKPLEPLTHSKRKHKDDQPQQQQQAQQIFSQYTQQQYPETTFNDKQRKISTEEYAQPPQQHNQPHHSNTYDYNNQIQSQNQQQQQQQQQPQYYNNDTMPIGQQHNTNYNDHQYNNTNVNFYNPNDIYMNNNQQQQQQVQDQHDSQQQQHQSQLGTSTSMPTIPMFKVPTPLTTSSTSATIQQPPTTVNSDYSMSNGDASIPTYDPRQHQMRNEYQQQFTEINHQDNRQRRHSRTTSESDSNSPKSQQQQQRQKINEDEDDDDDFLRNKKSNKENDAKNNNKKDAAKAENDNANKPGLLSRWFGGGGGEKKPKPAVAKLPSDKKKTIVWDDKLGKYVNTGESEQAQETIKPPPIGIPASNPQSATPQTQNQPQQQQQQQRPLLQVAGTTANNNDQAPLIPQKNQFSLQKKKATSYYASLDKGATGMGGKTVGVTTMNPNEMASLLNPLAVPTQGNFFVPSNDPDNDPNNVQPSSFYQPLQSAPYIPPTSTNDSNDQDNNNTSTNNDYYNNSNQQQQQQYASQYNNNI